MTDQPREKLCELIATYGRALCDDPRRCEALLRDVCGAYRREIHVLVSALRERVAADLLAASEGVPREVLRARLTQRLQDNLGLAEEIARWAVDSWALALGKLSPADVSQATTGAIPSAPVKVAGAAPNTRRRLLAGLGTCLLVVLVVALLNVPQKPERPAPNSQRKPEETRQETENIRGPYPFGQVDPVSYLKSLIPAAWSDVWQASPDSYCLGKQKEGRFMYCVTEVAGTVAVIKFPLGMAKKEIDLAQNLVWLKLTEGRDGEDYLLGSPYTLNELVRRLAEASREMETSRLDRPLILGPHTFIFDRKNESWLVWDTDYLLKAIATREPSSTPGSP